MATLIVIPARMASTRFPGKVLAEVAGKTLIQLVWERALEVPGIAGVRVATDHPDVLSHLRGLGADAVMTSPEHRSGTDRVAEAAADWSGPVLNLQGDEPLFDRETVGRLVRRLEDDASIPMGTAALPLTADEREHPDRVKVLRGADGFAVDFRRRLEGEPTGGVTALRHAGVYLYQPGALRRFVAAGPCERERAETLEQLRALALGLRIWVELAREWGPGVDRPEDLNIVAKRLAGA